MVPRVSGKNGLSTSATKLAGSNGTWIKEPSPPAAGFGATMRPVPRFAPQPDRTSPAAGRAVARFRLMCMGRFLRASAWHSAACGRRPRRATNLRTLARLAQSGKYPSRSAPRGVPATNGSAREPSSSRGRRPPPSPHPRADRDVDTLQLTYNRAVRPTPVVEQSAAGPLAATAGGWFPAQWSAVSAPIGPVMVLAGPGAGKTRCLTGRIQYLVEVIGTTPQRICAVTFTNKAAEEIVGRLRLSMGVVAEEPWLGTIHALCLELLRPYAKAMGLPPGFGVADETQQATILGRLRVFKKRHGQLLRLFGLRRLT